MEQTVKGKLKRDTRLIQNGHGDWEASPAPGGGILHLRGELVTVDVKSRSYVEEGVIETETTAANKQELGESQGGKTPKGRRVTK